MKTTLSLLTICFSVFLLSCKKENFIQTQDEQSNQSFKVSGQTMSSSRDAGGTNGFDFQRCYTSATNPAAVSAWQGWRINWDGTITIRTTFPTTFVDNTYGTNAIGWVSRGHTFRDLVGSDNLQLALYDAANIKMMEFKLDYITASATAPSGYTTLGVRGGEGGMILGSADDVVSVRTSIDENLNTSNYVLTTNSPSTDINYSPNSDHPLWIYEVWYEVTVKPSAFGTAGFGIPAIASIHASPSKTGNNTEPVVAVPCIGEDGSGESTGGGTGTNISKESIIGSDFNKTPIATGNTIWFNANLKVSGKVNANTIIKIDNGSVSFSGINIPLPSSIITFSSSPAAPVYDAINNVWRITASISNKEDIFFTGIPYVSPGLPGNIKPVNFKSVFTTNQAGIKLQWQWSAAVFNTSMSYDDLNVTGIDVDDYKAGAPVGYKEHIIGGARGNGGDNFTGSWSKGVTVFK